MDDWQEYLLLPLSQFSKEDIKEMRVLLMIYMEFTAHIHSQKDYRRNYERIVDRYDGAVQRFCSQSKVKEASALREVSILARQ